jgi:hypothetical protein
VEVDPWAKEIDEQNAEKSGATATATVAGGKNKKATPIKTDSIFTAFKLP